MSYEYTYRYATTVGIKELLLKIKSTLNKEWGVVYTLISPEFNLERLDQWLETSQDSIKNLNLYFLPNKESKNFLDEHGFAPYPKETPYFCLELWVYENITFNAQLTDISSKSYIEEEDYTLYWPKVTMIEFISPYPKEDELCKLKLIESIFLEN